MYFTKWYRLVGLFSICLAYSVYTYYNKVKKEKKYKENLNISSALPEEMNKLKADDSTKKPDLMTIDRPLYYRVFVYGVFKPLLYSGLFYILDLWWYTMQWY